MSRCGTHWTNGIKFSDLDFADDISVLTDDSYGLQTLVNNITSLAKYIGLSINAKKTKNMVIGSFSNDIASIFNDHEEVELVDSFKYLGGSMSSFGDIGHEINHCIGKASAASQPAEENLI